MPDAGLYTIPVALTFDGVEAQVETQLNRAFDGRSIGQQFGRDMASGLRSSQGDVDRAARGYTQLRDRAADALGDVRREETALQDLRRRGITSGRDYVDAEERLATARRNHSRANRDAEDGLRALNRAQDDTSRNSSRMGGILDGLGGKVAGLGVLAAGAAATGVLALGAAAVVVVKQLYDLGAEFDDVFDNLRLKTGDTGPALLELQNATERLARNVPLSIGEIGDVVAETTRALRLTGPELDNTATAIANLGRLTGENVDIRSLGKAFRGFGVDAADQVGALDSLFQASQATGIGVNQLVASAVKGGAALREFGLGLGESAALMATFEDAGLDGEKAIAGMQKAFAYFAAQGIDDPRQGLQDVVTEIQNLVDAGNDAAAADLTNKVFGAKGGVNFFDLIKDGALDLNALADSVSGAGDTIAQAAEDTDDWAEKWQTFKNDISFGLQPIATGVFDAVNEKLTQLSTWIQDNKAEAIEFFGSMGDAAIDGLSKILTFASGSLRGISDFVETMGNTWGPMFDQLSDAGGILKFVPGFYDLGSAMEAIGDAGGAITTGLGEVPGVLDSAAGGLDAVNSRLPTLQSNWDAIIARTADSTRFVEALGEATASVPDGKEILLSDNSPEVIEGLEELGIKVETLPDGTITVKANTAEGQRIMDAWRNEQTGAPLEVPATVQVGQILGPDGRPLLDNQFIIRRSGDVVTVPQTDPANILPQPPAAFGAIREYAFGKLPAQAVVQPATRGLVQWAEPSTHGEAFIPLAPDRRARSLAIWAETGRRLGVRGFDDGAVTDDHVAPSPVFEIAGWLWNKLRTLNPGGSGVGGSWELGGIRSFAQGGLNDAGGLLPFTSELRALIGQTWPQISEIGGYRSPDGYNEHSSGRALDVMIPNWQSPAGIALGNQIAAWALSIPGVNRVMWQQSTIHPDGSRTPVPDRGSPTQNHMDHVHIFTDDVAPGMVPTPSLSFGTSMAASTATSGVGPNGESGTYSVDQGAVSEAQGRVAEADARVREAEAKQRELEADAKESEVIAAQNEVDSAKRAAAEARSALSEAQKGEFTPNSESNSSNSGSGDMSEVGGIFKSFLTETFGLDGSWLPDIGNLMPLQMADTLLNAFHPEALYQPGAILNRDGTTPLPGSPAGVEPGGAAGPSGSTSLSTFGIPDTMSSFGLPNTSTLLPAMDSLRSNIDPEPDMPGGTININNSMNFNGNVGWDPAEANRQHQRNMKRNRAEPRLPTGF